VPTDTPSPDSTSPFALAIPSALVEQIAERAAQLVLEQLQPGLQAASPYMTIPEAAAYARCKRQRIDDLLSSRRLTRYKDGRRTLVSRAELEARLQGRPHPGHDADPAVR
jgi:excisionase family DNA binding protein